MLASDGRTTFFNAKLLLPGVAVAACQVVPLSSETLTVFPACRAEVKVPVTLCAATLVMKSDALRPVSAEREAELTP